MDRILAKTLLFQYGPSGKCRMMFSLAGMKLRAGASKSPHKGGVSFSESQRKREDALDSF